MLVGRRMFKNIVTIDKADKVSFAFEVMKCHGIRHLPVMEGQKLVGILTDRDIRQAFVPRKSSSTNKVIKFQIEDIPVGDLMTPNPITVAPQTSIEEATRLIIKHKIGGLPVLEGDKLVGIITETDILQVCVEIMGIIRSSSRIDVILGEHPEAFEKVSRIIKSYGVDIISVGMSAHTDKKERIYYFRMEKCNLEPLVAEIQKAGFRVESVLD